MIALYASAVSLLNLLFEIINASFPDALNFSYDRFSSECAGLSLRFWIVFPIYIFLSWFINKDLADNPLKKNLGIRKWLTYLTLFVARRYHHHRFDNAHKYFLGGEITARFAFKILAVLIVAGGSSFYLLSLRFEARCRAKIKQDENARLGGLFRRLGFNCRRLLHYGFAFYFENEKI